MISIQVILAILLIHWVADFHLQTHEQAINKSSDNLYLTQHVASYSMVWGAVVIIYGVVMGFSAIAFFAPITFVCHWITDYYTSRQVKKRFDKQDFHNGFVWIGFDQILHYTQLFTTYLLLR